MIVSGGHILAIDGVDHDFTLSGDGVRTPIGITEELLEKIRDVSGKLDTTAFETWSAQTEHWDVQEYSGGEGINVENHLISVSAKYLTSGDLEPYATQQWVKDQEFLTSGDLEPYAKTQWVQEELEKKQDASAMSAYATSAWVSGNFQPVGDYITPEDLKPYATSAWVNEELAKKVDLTEMSAYATSAWVEGNFLKQADYHEYSAGNDYIRVDEYKIYGYDWTSAVSAVPFKLDTSSFNDYSGWADETYLKEDALEPYATSAGLDENQQYAMTNSGWAPVDIPDETVVSGTSGISAQKIGDAWIVGTSAKFATSGDIDPDKQYALTTSGWTEVEIPKDYPEVQAGPNINVHSAYSTDDPTLVSAYVLSGHKAAALTSSGGSLEITSSGEQSFNIDVKRVAPEYASYYNGNDTAIGTSFTEITLKRREESEDFPGLEGLRVGLYHVDATFAIQRSSNAVNRGMERIEFSNNGTDKLLDLGEFDASSSQINYVNISFDKFNPARLLCYLKAETAGWIVNIERFDVHRVFDMNLIGNIISELSDYSDGDGIFIDDTYHTINVVPSSGIMIDPDNKVAMNISSGIKFDPDKRAYIPLTSGIGYEADGSLKALISSGLAFDEDKYMYVPLSSGLAYDEKGIYVKVGDGLKFDDEQGVMAITIDSQVEEVVETVEELKGDMASKLTTNFPYPMITDVSFDFGQHNMGGACICQLFSVPFRHQIIVDETYITVYTKDVGYGQSNVMFGIFEYDPAGNQGEGTTNFICDTGAISIAKTQTSDILEFPIKHLNSDEDHQALRPDRLYYAVLAMPSSAGSGIFLASCKNYDSNVNSMPTLNWRMDNTNQYISWDDPQNASLEQTRWWDSGYNEDSTLYRFFMQIRNHITVN